VDHVAGAAQARAATSARLSIHADDEDWLLSLPRQAEVYGFEGAEIPTVDFFHAHGDEVTLGRHTGRIIHTPGHSAGSCCLWFPEDDVLLTGDTLFSGSVGRTDLPGGDFDALAASIRQRIFPLGDDVTFHPGHGPPGQIGEERRHNPFVGDSPPGRGLQY
jgi:glyoxylase-like metal-dependent hydrolase (beta-lactamase superfamily II)